MRSWVVIGLALLSVVASGQETVPLVDLKNPGWTFDNGREFPGATGGLSVDQEAQRAGRGSLKLVGDFTKGGNYVQLGRKIDAVDIRELSFWIKSPEADRFTLRINDSTGQTHQLAIKTAASDDWQEVVVPLEAFFAKRGAADAVTSIAKYESWGGAKDGKWHGPAKAIYILISAGAESKVRNFWMSELNVTPRRAEVTGARVTSVVALDEVLEGEHDWRLSLGQEVKGAKGSLSVVKDQPEAGKTCLKLEGNFTGGGAYVAAIKEIADLEAKDLTAIRLRARSENCASVSVIVVDSTGQTHQRKGIPVVADGQWHEMVLKPAEIAGIEHWGGANDGKWHGPARQFVVSVTSGSDRKEKKPVLYLAEVRADVVLPVFAAPAAYREAFEGDLSGWKTAGDVKVERDAAYKGAGSLLLSRKLEDVEKACRAASPAFAVSKGQWKIDLACKANLKSPDNSYNAVVTLECMDGGGKVVEKFPLAEVFGMREWKPVSKVIEMPAGAATARFVCVMNKSEGSVGIDELSAAFLAPPVAKDDRVTRILFSTAALGNLLMPEDSRKVGITVEAKKPLRDSQHALTWVVRDYWGAEQTKASTVTLAKKQGGKLSYEASIDLSDSGLEIGRYYEIHATIPREGDAPFANHTSLAILPPAVTKQYKPEEVPFTGRSWDNRSSEYIRLVDRLGVRVCGIWGGWSPKPPYKAEAPNLELASSLGMGWLTGTPASTIERGKKEYDETALRQGVRNLIENFGKHRPMYINLGNEPHGTGQRVLDNVAAYKALYEEIKKVDPTITVIATAVEPNEEYFKAGYGKYCDAYDFHIYEGARDVREAMRQYRELMTKYDVVRPIWSTELGLNSQGMTRHVVAVEVVKKFTTFFAAGGTNMSWFSILYPDADGKSHGSSGDSHNVFDSRFNRYAPRLDAIAYYNMVNAIAIKKFVAEKEYEGGVRASLFRDREGKCLQVLWKEEGRADVTVPLSGVSKVDVVRIDGSRRVMAPGTHGLALTVSSDPLLLLYDGGAEALPATLGAAVLSIREAPATIGVSGTKKLTVALNGVRPEDVGMIAPPGWRVEKIAGAAEVSFTLTPPAATGIRQMDVTVTWTEAGTHRRGELYWRAPITR